jgi:hypothetical protein
MARPKKKEADNTFDAKAYSNFIDNLEIRQVFLLRASSERFGFPESNATLSFDIEVETAELSRFDDKSGFVARLPFTLNLIAKTDKGRPERFASLGVTFEAIYTTKTPITDEFFEVFKETSLKWNLWSYVREHVHSTTLKMGLPGLVMPHFKIL